MDTITIPKHEYVQLVHDATKFAELEAAGVENWDGYYEVDFDVVVAAVRAAEAL